MGIAVIPAPSGGLTQKVQEFTSTGSFVTPSNVTSVEVFLVAGGGGGGQANTGLDYQPAGGGGGGGVVSRNIPVTAGTTYTVTIGAGGAHTSVGSDSTFGALLTAKGGGAGQPSTGAWPSNGLGGCGGGGRYNAQYYAAGGGGGAGQSIGMVRENRTSKGLQGGNGGVGNPVNFPVNAGGGIGIDGYGGGGGGGYRGGGAAGGGSGTDNTDTTAEAGAVNTGGGGGGGNSTGLPTVLGGAGGSGYCRVVYWS